MEMPRTRVEPIVSYSKDLTLLIWFTEKGLCIALEMDRRQEQGISSCWKQNPAMSTPAPQADALLCPAWDNVALKVRFLCRMTNRPATKAVIYPSVDRKAWEKIVTGHQGAGVVVVVT